MRIDQFDPSSSILFERDRWLAEAPDTSRSEVLAIRSWWTSMYSDRRRVPGRRIGLCLVAVGPDDRPNCFNSKFQCQ